MARRLRVVLIHWKAEEAAERLDRLRRAGCEPRHLNPESYRFLRELDSGQPDAVVIDLSRLPSQGRAVGVDLRRRVATREIPLVFVEGPADKVAQTKAMLPDALYGTYDTLGPLLEAARVPAPAKLAVPDSMAGYSGTPLPKKLGIQKDGRVLLVNAPGCFVESLTPLPDGVELSEELRGEAALAVLFVRDRIELTSMFGTVTRRLGAKGRIWVAWPKKTSGQQTDMTGDFVREYGLAQKWVDFKICSIDKTWSGLCFARRKSEG